MTTQDSPRAGSAAVPRNDVEPDRVRLFCLPASALASSRPGQGSALLHASVGCLSRDLLSSGWSAGYRVTASRRSPRRVLRSGVFSAEARSTCRPARSDGESRPGTASRTQCAPARRPRADLPVVFAGVGIAIRQPLGPRCAPRLDVGRGARRPGGNLALRNGRGRPTAGLATRHRGGGNATPGPGEGTRRGQRRLPLRHSLDLRPGALPGEIRLLPSEFAPWR